MKILKNFCRIQNCSLQRNKTERIPLPIRFIMRSVPVAAFSGYILESAVMRCTLMLSQEERAFREGSVLLWHSAGMKGEFRHRDNRKDTCDGTLR